MATIAFLFHLSHLFKKNVIAYKTFFQAFFIFYSFNVDCNFSCLFVVNRVSHSMWIAISVAYLWSTVSHMAFRIDSTLSHWGKGLLDTFNEINFFEGRGVLYKIESVHSQSQLFLSVIADFAIIIHFMGK